jgi:ribosomal protein S3AE
MAKKRVSKQNIKKKTWFPILAPKMLGQRPIGETYLEEAEVAVGRSVKTNLMQVTGDIKTQHISARFEIIEFSEGSLKTSLNGYSYLPSSIKRMVRRRMSRVDDSLVIKTMDGVQIRIKPMVLTRGKVPKSVQYTIRANTKKLLIEVIAKKNYDELFSEVIKNRLQIELKNALTKLYPIRAVVIRELKTETHHSAKLTKTPKRVSKSKTAIEIKLKKKVVKTVEKKVESDQTKEVKAAPPKKEEVKAKDKVETPKAEEKTDVKEEVKAKAPKKEEAKTDVKEDVKTSVATEKTETKEDKPKKAAKKVETKEE